MAVRSGAHAAELAEAARLRARDDVIALGAVRVALGTLALIGVFLVGGWQAGAVLAAWWLLGCGLGFLESRARADRGAVLLFPSAPPEEEEARRARYFSREPRAIAECKRCGFVTAQRTCPRCAS